jgi:hypothetical protein
VSSRIPEPCDSTRGKHDGQLRFYTTGWKCSAHAPWALAGLPEPQPGPGLPADLPLSPLSTSHVHDARAIASGKRRSNPAAYRAAQAAVHHETT